MLIFSLISLSLILRCHYYWLLLSLILIIDWSLLLLITINSHWLILLFAGYAFAIAITAGLRWCHYYARLLSLVITPLRHTLLIFSHTLSLLPLLYWLLIAATHNTIQYAALICHCHFTATIAYYGHIEGHCQLPTADIGHWPLPHWYSFTLLMPGHFDTPLSLRLATSLLIQPGHFHIADSRWFLLLYCMLTPVIHYTLRLLLPLPHTHVISHIFTLIDIDYTDYFAIRQAAAIIFTPAATLATPMSFSLSLLISLISISFSLSLRWPLVSQYWPIATQAAGWFSLHCCHAPLITLLIRWFSVD